MKTPDDQLSFQPKTDRYDTDSDRLTNRELKLPDQRKAFKWIVFHSDCFTEVVSEHELACFNQKCNSVKIILRVDAPLKAL